MVVLMRQQNESADATVSLHSPLKRLQHQLANRNHVLARGHGLPNCIHPFSIVPQSLVLPAGPVKVRRSWLPSLHLLTLASLLPCLFCLCYCLQDLLA